MAISESPVDEASDDQEALKHSFENRLKSLINECCMENQSDTPDYILASYIQSCLGAFTDATRERDRYFGNGP